MKTPLILLISAVALATASAHEGHDHATGIVRERMILMEQMGNRLLAMSKRLRANKELDKIQGDARAVQELAGKVGALFPVGSTQTPTAAKPEVWQDWPDFEAKTKALEAEAGKLAKMTGADGNALRAQFRAVGFACDSCHEKYRMPQRK